MCNWIIYIVLCKREVGSCWGYGLHKIDNYWITLNNLILVVTHYKDEYQAKHGDCVDFKLQLISDLYSIDSETKL